MASKTEFFNGTGRRKSSVARIRMKPGKGSILINKRELKEYFPAPVNVAEVLAPLKDSGHSSDYDLFISVQGGGLCGQAGAIRMGIARALMVADEATEGSLRQKGHLTRDARMKERKKYGQKGARARFQFSKR